MDSRNTVVVIEDEALPRLQAAELFDLGGMSVQTFATGNEAIAFVRDHRDEVACIFTDLRLGDGADGLAVVRYVSSTLPDVTLILTSGAQPPADLPANVRFLPKPWLPSDVIAAIHDAT